MALLAATTRRAGALRSVNKRGWGRLCSMPDGICSFPGVLRPAHQPLEDYKSRLTWRGEPGHVSGGRPGVRAAVDPVLQ